MVYLYSQHPKIEKMHNSKLPEIKGKPVMKVVPFLLVAVAIANK